MVFVSKKRGESKDTLFRKFTKIFIEEEIVDDVRRKLFYKKPSLLRKEKEKEKRQTHGGRLIKKSYYRKSRK